MDDPKRRFDDQDEEIAQELIESLKRLSQSRETAEKLHDMSSQREPLPGELCEEPRG